MCASIKVSFHQHGTWDGRSFDATLAEHNLLSEALAGLDGYEGFNETSVVLTIDSEGPWLGMTFTSRANFPGRFATGYSGTVASALGGRLYTGDMRLLGAADGLPPPEVFSGTIGYLHVDGDEPVTDAQLDLLFRACYDRKGGAMSLFAAGASVSRLFPVYEIERRLGQRQFLA